MTSRTNPRIIYEDSDILVCEKPAGLPVQTAKTGRPDLVSELKNYRAKKHEEPYIGLVHRLDQPVCGVMVFAKTKAAAAHLSRQVSSRSISKEYLAVVCGLPESASYTESISDIQSGQEKHTLHQAGDLRDFLLKDGRTNTSRIVPEHTPGAKEARLSYKVIRSDPETGRSLVRIHLHTGRHHQIRVQFAHAGFPLYADTKYGQPLPAGSFCPVALCSYKISFIHPKTGKTMTFAVKDSTLEKLTACLNISRN
ncbi:MAG: RluA family pseudouridine synthase [Clostridiales bacterium]|nr:RluA family pseudouridine synthase [Clostridiales bacterium]